MKMKHSVLLLPPQFIQGGSKSFKNIFSSNLNSTNLKIFPGVMVGNTLENKSKPVFRIIDLYMRLISFKGRVKFSFPLVDPDLGY